jgi:hypothetical protein
MKIKRNFDVTVTIGNDDIVRYMSELENGSDACRELLEAMPDDSLAMFTAYYLAKLYEQDRDKYEKYVNAVRKTIEKDEPKKEEIKVPELKEGSIIQYNLKGNSYSVSTKSFGECFLRYEVIAKRDDFYVLRSTLFRNDVVKILNKSDFEELYKNKTITVIK